MQGLERSNIKGLELLNRGKVRDIYDAGDHLVIVATDRISAFDVVLPDPIPDKGRVLTALSAFWFAHTADICPNHLISTRMEDMPPEVQRAGEEMKGRVMLVRKAQPLPIEAIVRGYITGSGWKDYLATGQICGHKLPEGLKESQQLPEPIFTPSTKAGPGEHDRNITVDEAAELVGEDVARRVEEISLAIYSRASEMARENGIIIADTKLEFGWIDGELVVIDELLTPDSSRFWPADDYAPGRAQKSFDKQFVRDWLTSIGFNKRPPAPRLPQDVIEGTRARYLEALQRLTGKGLEEWLNGGIN